MEFRSKTNSIYLHVAIKKHHIPSRTHLRRYVCAYVDITKVFALQGLKTKTGRLRPGGFLPESYLDFCAFSCPHLLQLTDTNACRFQDKCWGQRTTNSWLVYRQMIKCVDYIQTIKTVSAKRSGSTRSGRRPAVPTEGFRPVGQNCDQRQTLLTM